MNVDELLTEGKLNEAIKLTTDKVRQQPFDMETRSILVELLILAGELERADKQLDIIAHQHPEAIAGVSLLRQLVRAEVARDQFFKEGRLPEFIDQPTEELQELLRASIHMREGKLDSAQAIYQGIEEHRHTVKGTCNGRVFDDFRDLDDRTSNILEILTSNGKYYWLPLTAVRKIEFHAPERPLDIKWRRAYIETTKEGLEGEVYISGVYFSPADATDDAARLGKKTEWIGEDGLPFSGIGQKMFLVGEDAKSVMEIEELTFEV